jgi:putative addiction module killer protein
MSDFLYYQSRTGRKPLPEWLECLDAKVRAGIMARLARLAVGNPGDVRPVGGGVLEMRVDRGPGYRLYYSRVGNRMILLLCGGDKSTQQRDIRRAQAYLEDFKTRSAKK